MPDSSTPAALEKRVTMTYQTAIPDDFVHPQYRDETFNKALAAYAARHRPGGPWVCAIPRSDIDPSSRARFDFASMATYKLGTKEDIVALMHVIGVGKGRVRLGYREVIPVAVGDLVFVNLREAGHWQEIEGVTTYWFTAEVAMARIYRTAKPITPPPPGPERDAWHDELFWNLRDVLNDYVVMGREPEAERLMRNGPDSLIHLTDRAFTDGLQSDDARDNRFPIVYRRVLGAGPGRVMRRESDLGVIDREETIPECVPGDMVTYSKSVRAAAFVFQGMPLEVMHCASTLDIESHGKPRLLVHESVPQPIPWDLPNDEDEEDPDPPPAPTE